MLRSSGTSSGATSETAHPAPPARGAANPVHVVLRHVRQIEIDHVRQLFDVEPPCRNLGRNQRGDPTGLEIGQGALARALTFVAMDGGGANAATLELLRQPIGAALRAREHEHLLPAATADEVCEQMPLMLLGNSIHELLDAIRRHAEALCRVVAGLLLTRTESP